MSSPGLGIHPVHDDLPLEDHDQQGERQQEEDQEDHDDEVGVPERFVPAELLQFHVQEVPVDLPGLAVQLDGVLVQPGAPVLQEVVERAGGAAAAVRVVPQPQPGPLDGGVLDQLVEVVDV